MRNENHHYFIRLRDTSDVNLIALDIIFWCVLSILKFDNQIQCGTVISWSIVAQIPTIEFSWPAPCGWDMGCLSLFQISNIGSISITANNANLIPVITLHLSIVAKKHSIATITKLRSLELLIKTPLLHILYYINGLTHDFWTRTGGWEFDRSHGAGTSSPSHWQQVEEQAPKPVGWTMCFLLMTLVPVQKLCVNIYVYICVHSLYEFCYRSYIQRECHSVLAKLHPITFYRGVRGSWSECHFVFSLVYQLCLALW